MNKKLLIAVFVSAMAHTFACAASPKENRMKTVWADKVTSENVWQSYPRPQLQRSQWMNRGRNLNSVPKQLSLYYG